MPNTIHGAHEGYKPLDKIKLRIGPQHKHTVEARKLRREVNRLRKKNQNRKRNKHGRQ